MVYLHEVFWVKLDIDVELFLEFHHRTILGRIHEVKSELELTMGTLFLEKFLHILNNANGQSIEAVKQNLYPLICDLESDTIPEVFTEILSEFMEMFKVYADVKNPIYIRISDEIYFQGKMNKAEIGCFFIDVNGFYAEYLLYDIHEKNLRNDNIKFPQLILPVLKAVDMILNNAS